MAAYLYIVLYGTADSDADWPMLAFDHITVEADSDEDAYLLGGRKLSRDRMINDYVIRLAPGLRVVGGAA